MLLRLYEVKKLKRHSRSILVSLTNHRHRLQRTKLHFLLLARNLIPSQQLPSTPSSSKAVLSRVSTCIHTTLSMTELKAYDKMSKEVRDVHDQQQREKEKKEQAGELLHFLGPVLVWRWEKRNCISATYHMLIMDLSYALSYRTTVLLDTRTCYSNCDRSFTQRNKR